MSGSNIIQSLHSDTILECDALNALIVPCVTDSFDAVKERD